MAFTHASNSASFQSDPPLPHTRTHRSPHDVGRFASAERIMSDGLCSPNINDCVGPTFLRSDQSASTERGPMLCPNSPVTVCAPGRNAIDAIAECGEAYHGIDPSGRRDRFRTRRGPGGIGRLTHARQRITDTLSARGLVPIQEHYSRLYSGTPLPPPRRFGFGTSVVRELMPYELAGTADTPPRGCPLQTAHPGALAQPRRQPWRSS